MARRRQLNEPVPEQLCRFVAAEWPGELWDGYAAWKAARREWGAAHPDSVLGDVVDQLRAERATRLRLTCPPS
jgi:hypothetical protein